LARFWGNVGRMEPLGEPVRTDVEGRFRAPIQGTRVHHVLVMNPARTRGALGIVPVGREGEPLALRLEPLVRVTGQIRGPASDEKPKWTNIYTSRLEEPERPLDRCRLMHCGSFDANFSMLLPPGRYQFHAYSDPMTSRVIPEPGLTITGTEHAIDLGTLVLSPVSETPFVKLRQDEAVGKIRPLKDHVGQSPPAIFADDARGVSKDWQLGRASGKWQLVEFWGMDCPVCLSRTLPDLMKFQEEHADQASQFEIVTVFMDVEGKIRTIAQMDVALRPIVQHVWGGKALPFPILVDPTTRTCESWGLSGYGEMSLINPEGKIVPGDIAELRAALANKKSSGPH